MNTKTENVKMCVKANGVRVFTCIFYTVQFHHFDHFYVGGNMAHLYANVSHCHSGHCSVLVGDSVPPASRK